MLVSVEFLLGHTSELCEVGRIPCVGEHVCIGSDDDAATYEVKSVIHMVGREVFAIVRVK